MAIIKCPNCGEKVSTHAQQCPHCGIGHDQLQLLHKNKNSQKRKQTIGFVVLVMALLVVLVSFICTWESITDIRKDWYDWNRSSFSKICPHLGLAILLAVIGGCYIGKTTFKKFLYALLGSVSIVGIGGIIYTISYDDINDPISRYYVENVVFGKGGAKVDGTQWETSHNDDTKHIVAFSKDSVYIQLNDLIFKDTYTVKGDTVYLGEVTTENHYPKFYHSWAENANLKINGTDKSIVEFQASRPDNQLLEQFTNAPSNPIIPKQKNIVASDLIKRHDPQTAPYGDQVEFRDDWKDRILELGFKLTDSNKKVLELDDCDASYYGTPTVISQKDYYTLSQKDNNITILHEFTETAKNREESFGIKFQDSDSQQNFIESLLEFGYKYEGQNGKYNDYGGLSGINWRANGRKIVSVNTQY